MQYQYSSAENVTWISKTTNDASSDTCRREHGDNRANQSRRIERLRDNLSCNFTLLSQYSNILSSADKSTKYLNLLGMISAAQPTVDCWAIQSTSWHSLSWLQPQWCLTITSTTRDRQGWAAAPISWDLVKYYPTMMRINQNTGDWRVTIWKESTRLK